MLLLGLCGVGPERLAIDLDDAAMSKVGNLTGVVKPGEARAAQCPESGTAISGTCPF